MLELLDPTGLSTVLSGVSGLKEFLSELNEKAETVSFNSKELVSELKKQTGILSDMRGLMEEGNQYSREMLDIQREEQGYKRIQRKLKNQIFLLNEFYEGLEKESQIQQRVKAHLIKDYTLFFTSNYRMLSNCLDDFGDKKVLSDLVAKINLFEQEIDPFFEEKIMLLQKANEEESISMKEIAKLMEEIEQSNQGISRYNILIVFLNSVLIIIFLFLASILGGLVSLSVSSMLSATNFWPIATNLLGVVFSGAMFLLASSALIFRLSILFRSVWPIYIGNSQIKKKTKELKTSLELEIQNAKLISERKNKLVMEFKELYPLYFTVQNELADLQLGLQRA